MNKEYITRTTYNSDNIYYMFSPHKHSNLKSVNYREVSVNTPHLTVANVTHVRTISGFGKRQFIGILYVHIIYIHYIATVLVVDDTKCTIH